MSATEARRVLGMISSYSKASVSRNIRSVPFSVVSATEARRVLGMTSFYSKASGSRNIRSVPFSKEPMLRPKALVQGSAIW